MARSQDQSNFESIAGTPRIAGILPEDGPLRPGRRSCIGGSTGLGPVTKVAWAAPSRCWVQLVRADRVLKARLTSVVGKWCVSGSTQTNTQRSASLSTTIALP
jgi:hypothetical protein